MKNASIYTFASLIFCCLTLPLAGQSFPLSENDWRNPDFVKRFLGSYGVRSDIEPPALTRDEARFYNESVLPPAQAGNYAEAIRVLRAFITPEINANFDFTLATLLIQVDDLQQAITYYRSALAKVPTFLRAYKNMGFAHTRLGQHQEAIQMLAKAIELGDGHGDTYGLLGYNYYSLGQYASALDAYRMATLLNGENPDWKIGRARALLESRRFDDAIAATDELLLQNPTDVRFWLNRINSLIGKAEFEEAAYSLEVIRRLGSAPISSLQLLGDIYLNLGLPSLALPPYKEAVQRQRTTEEGLRIARNLTDRSHFEEAAEILQILSARPQDAMDEDTRISLLNLNATVAFSRGQTESGLQILNDILVIDPLNATTLRLLADHYVHAGDIEQASFYFDRVQAVGSNDQKFDAFVQHGVLMARQRQFQKSMDLLNAALRIRFERRIADYLDAVQAAAGRL